MLPVTRHPSLFQMKSHKDLDVWTKSIDLVTEIYRVTNEFPKEEIYGITNQMRRAAVSIPSNISEGAARHHPKEFVRFLYMALGSASELETQLIISEKLMFISNIEGDKCQEEINSIRKMLIGLIKSIQV